MKKVFFSNLKDIIRNIKRYNKNSVFFHYMKIFMLVFLIPVVLVNIMFTSYNYKSLVLNAENVANQRFSSIVQSINNVYDETNKIYLMLMSDDVMRLFFKENVNIVTDSFARSRLLDAYKSAAKFSEVSNTIDSVTVISKTCGYVLSPDGNGYIADFQNFYDLEERASKQSGGMNFLISTDNSRTFSICYNYFDNKTVKGRIIFEINGDALLDLGEENLRNIQTVALYNNFEQMIYHNGTEECEPDFGVVDDAISMRRNYNRITATTKVYDMLICMSILMPEMSVSQLIFLALLCMIFTIIISVILAAVVSLKYYVTVDKIVMEINEFIPVSNNDDVTDEIGFITDNIIQMQRKNLFMEQELITHAEELKNTQIAALQMQFNPHFLFNALNALNMYLIQEHGIRTPTSKMVVLLSDIMCESMNTANYMVRISQEIEYLKKYLAFQSLMNSGSFNITWDVDSAITDCYMIKFTLQPLIENAIKYGVKSLNGKTTGWIHISIKEQNKKVIFTVSNNCAKLDLNKIADVQRSLDEKEMPSVKNIGLKNVNKRIRLIFGDDYYCHIHGENNVFTVEISIPRIDRL